MAYIGDRKRDGLIALILTLLKSYPDTLIGT